MPSRQNGKPDEKVVASKWANALIASATMSQLAKDVVGVLPHARNATSVLDGFQKYYGGLWVGGIATLTNEHLLFKPNAVNRLVQDGELELSIPVQTITSVTLEGGFFTKIIAIATPRATVRIRCYGAAGFAKQIREVARLG